MKILVICGPTASGKSAYALLVARLLHGEIISGDSIQVYRGLDIGSGKAPASFRQQVPHHLLDIYDPQQGYSVADFQRMARELFTQCAQRGSLPVLCGGTGLYLKAACYDYDFFQQRRAVDADLTAMSNCELVSLLQQQDPACLDRIHPHNRQRLLRAAMIARSGIRKSDREKNQSHQPIADIFFLGLTCSRQTLNRRIEQRVQAMFAQGLRQEVQGLLQQGVDFSMQSMQGIGYREWKPYFAGEASVEQVKKAILVHSQQLAKRQYTWFNHQLPVQWLNIEEDYWQQRGLKWIEQWLAASENGKGPES